MPDCVKCLPIFAIRTGNISIEVLENLCSKRLSTKRAELAQVKDHLERAANRVIDMLYHVIGSESNHHKRVQILELRRLLLDRKKIHKLAIERVENILSSDYQREINNLVEIAKRHLVLLHEYRELYDSEIQRIRLEYKRALAQPNYLHGVLFASANLFSNTEKYLKSRDNINPKKADRIVEFSHLNYLLRSAVKTSPFATFTQITLGRFENVPQFHFRDDFSVAKALVLDRNMVQDILDALRSRSEIRNHLRVYPNPTLIHKGSYYSFYHEKVVRANADNQTKSQTTYTWDLPTNPTLDLVVRLVEQNKPPFEELIEQLVQITKTDEAVVTKYIENLLELGVLESHYPFSELTHAILDELIRFLSIFTESEICSISNLLKEIKQHMDILGQHDFENDDLLTHHKETINAVTEIHQRLNVDSKRKQFLYEDSCLPNIDCSLPNSFLDEIKNDLCILNKVGTCCYHSQSFKLLNMQYVFKNYFTAAKEVDIVSFFNKYFEVLNARLVESRMDRERMRNPFGIKEFDLLGEYQEKLLDVFRSAYAGKGEASYVNKDKLNALLNSPPEFVEFSTYFCAYLQKEAGSMKPWVLNEMRSGYYKFMSRFIYLASRYRNDFINTKTENFKFLHEFEHTNKDIIIAELGFIFASNSNVHAPLTKYRIRFPGCYCENSDYIIELNDLRVRLDHKGRPYLFSFKLGKRVMPIHVGLTNIQHAPAFYQFLLNFGTPEPFVPKPHGLQRPSWQGFDMKIPRIFVGNLMFSRQRWLIEKASIPIKKGDQSDAELFCQLNEWREDHGLPSRVFLIHVPFWKDDTSKSEGDEQLVKGKKVKPHFLDFENLLMVKYFDKCIGEFISGPFVLFEECYPDLSKLMFSSEKLHVSEFLFEFFISEN